MLTLDTVKQSKSQKPNFQQPDETSFINILTIGLQIFKKVVNDVQLWKNLSVQPASYSLFGSFYSSEETKNIQKE